MRRNRQWTPDEAWMWQERQPWRCGFNYLPQTAVNSTEMWQAETWDLPTIREELALAATVGFNCCRVFLPFVVWDSDPDGFLSRLDQFLQVAAQHRIVTMPILFDDCAFAGREPHLGPQSAPLPGTHNSGWTPSPGFAVADHVTWWPRLREYVVAVVERFAEDRRVFCWDVYNEPGNSGRGDRSLPLLEAAFDWCRQAAPSQPLTCGTWDGTLETLVAYSHAHSDVISFHRYASADDLTAHIAHLRQHGRPLLCTEWMARTLDSHFATHLPIFHREKVAALHWGLVNGKTQTHLPWGWTADRGEPAVWFHDVFHPDGTPYDAEEIVLLRAVIGAEER